MESGPPQPAGPQAGPTGELLSLVQRLVLICEGPLGQCTDRRGGPPHRVGAAGEGAPAHLGQRSPPAGRRRGRGAVCWYG